MIIFIPVIILLLFVIALQVLGRFRFNIIQNWILAVGGAFLSWLSLILLRVFSLGDFSSEYLLTEGSDQYISIFHLDEQNWMFGLLLLTLLLSVLLFDADRLWSKHNLLAYSGALGIGAFGLLTILSGSLIAFLLTTGILDIIILASHLVMQRNETHIKYALFDFIQKVTGTFLIMAGMGVNGNINPFIICFGFLFRLGNLSIVLDTAHYSSIRNNLLAFFELIVPLSVFSFMSIIDLTGFSEPGKNWLLFILYLLWLAKFSKSNTHAHNHLGNKAWMEYFSLTVLLLLIMRHNEKILPMASAFVMLGGIQALAAKAGKQLKFLLLILLIGSIGLPFTPTYGIWLTSSQETPLFFLATYNLGLFIGLLQAFGRVYSPSLGEQQKTDWIKFMLGASSIFLLLVPWLQMIWLKNRSVEKNGILLPTIFFAVLTLFLFLQSRWKTSIFQYRILKTQDGTPLRYLNWVKKFLSFEWTYKIFSFFVQIISFITRSFARTIEGEGGLLWAFVFLIIISTILLTSQYPK